MDKSWEESVVLIVSSDSDEQSFGTGFVIHRDQQTTYLLTCTHVVREIGGPGKIQINASLAKVIASSPEEEADLAILSLEGLPDAPSLPLRVAGEKGKPFSTVGFQLAGKQFVIRELSGTLGKQVGVQMRRQAGRIKAWDLEITDKDPLQSGYSGSPVIDEHGDVIGMVNTQRAEGKIGAAISIEALEKLQLEMPPDLFLQIVRLAPIQVQYDAAMQAQRWDEAQTACTEALRLAPEDKGWQQRQAHVRMARASAELPHRLRNCRTATDLRVSRRTVVRVGTASIATAVVGTGVFIISHLHSSSARSVTPPDRTVIPPQGSPVPLLIPLATLTGHTGQVLSVAWSPNGKYIASAGNDNTVRVWNWETNPTASPRSYYGQPFPVSSVAWSPDSKQLVSGGGDQRVQVCNVTANTISGQIGNYDNEPDPGGYISSVAWSPNGAFIADGGFHCKVWHAGGGSPLLVYQGHWPAHVNAVAWSPDRNSGQIASAGEDETVQVWNASNGMRLFTGSHASTVLSVTWSPDGTRIASASADGTVQVWDVRNAGRHLLTPQKISGKVYGVSWSPDGKRLASANSDGTVQVWDANTPGENLRIHQNPDEVYTVSWSPDSKRIAAGTQNGTIQVWMDRI